MHYIEVSGVQRHIRGCILVSNIDHTLGVRIAEVGLVRETQVDLGLVEGVGDLVGIHTRREARDDLLDVGLVRGVQDVVVDQDVLAEEGELAREVMMRW